MVMECDIMDLEFRWKVREVGYLYFERQQDKKNYLLKDKKS